MKSTICIGRSLPTAGTPKDFELPAYLGYSAGHWDHDVLVVETAGFNDKTPFDTMGTLIAKRCASRNVSIAATSDTWTSR